MPIDASRDRCDPSDRRRGGDDDGAARPRRGKAAFAPFAWAALALALALPSLSRAQAQAQAQAQARDEIRTVFACEPEWAALTRQLLPQARLHVATHAKQDPHHIEARPALIAQLRSADAAICTGAELESGWLPVLLQRAGNARVQEGTPGLFLAASAVTLIDAQPGAVGNPFSGDVHAAGNPHIQADPRRLLEVARAWAARLQQLFPAQQAEIAQRLSAFEAGWSARIAGWEQAAAGLRGRRVAAQHAGFSYLWHWLGIEQVADLEPKPGLSPTPGHLQRLLDRLRDDPPAAIVITAYQDPRAARWLATQLDGRVPVLQLPSTVEDPEAADALGRWFDGLLQQLGAR